MNGITRILLVIALLGVRAAFALDPERHISELAHRSWGSKDGAPGFARAITQTPDGYLWIGGFRGLDRFDGTRFVPFETVTGHKLPSREIRCLFTSAQGGLWIGYRSGGVSVLEAGKLTNYTSANGFPEGYVRGFAQDPEGRTWAASSGGIAVFEGGRWHAVGKESNFPGSGAQAVLVDHLGALWVAGEHRVAVLEAGSSKFELTDEPFDGQVGELVESPDGTVWMAETTRAVRPLAGPGHGTPYHGMSRLECQTRFPDTWQTEPPCRRSDDLEVRVGSTAMLFDRDGSFWITTVGDGLRRAPYPRLLEKAPIGEFSAALEQLTSKDGLSADYITSIFEDREGNIWVATSNGVDQFRDSALAPVDPGSNSGEVFLVPGDNGYVFGLGNSNRIYRFHDDRERAVVAVTGSNELARLGPARFLYRDLRGSIWLQGTSGACRLVFQHCAESVERPGEKGWATGHLGEIRWRLAIDRDGRFWAYQENGGLFFRENGHWMPVMNSSSGATGLVPETQSTDASGQIWFGFTNGQLLSVKDGQIRTYSPDDGLSVGAVKAIDSIGPHVWVGGERGLALLVGSRFISVLPYDLPAFDNVSGVIEGADGSLWLNEYRGVIRISPAEVEGILENNARRAHYEVLDALDGLPGDTQVGEKLPTAIRGTDGRIWFAAARGVAWVNPRHLYRNGLAPPVAIQSIVADGKALAPSKKLELPGTFSNLQIAYSGLSLSVPERVQFRYRLSGLDQEWQNAGARRTAYYSRLSPGSYDFQVIASNDAGVWNSVGAGLRIIVLRAWYQTWWFYTLCALLLVASLATFYRKRVAQVRKETRRLLEARLSERERISRELHDTLLQGIQGLIWRFQAATNRIPPDQPARELLEQSLERADQLLEESRDKVKDLRPSAGEVADLDRALAAEGEHLAHLHTAKFGLTVHGARRDLQTIVREEAFMIGREALCNALRHSGAEDVEVEVTYGDSALYVRVKDDGRGISASVLEAGGSPGHFGLIGMQERAKKLGGHLKIWSKPEAGTEIELKVPANVAYVRLGRPSGMRSLFAIFRRRPHPH
jgi:signal transduction histidine kinase/ligand-binding sensor domain-containing protein